MLLPHTIFGVLHRAQAELGYLIGRGVRLGEVLPVTGSLTLLLAVSSLELARLGLDAEAILKLGLNHLRQVSQSQVPLGLFLLRTLIISIGMNGNRVSGGRGRAV